MSVTVDLQEEEMAKIRLLTEIEDDAAAVAQAAREFIRLTRLRELKTASGEVDYHENWHSLEALELREKPPGSER